MFLKQTDRQYILVIVLAVAIFIAGAWLRLHDLGRQSLWQDEINTVVYVKDLPTVAETIRRVATWDLHSPLYYVLLLFQVKIYQAFGIPSSDGNLRILSALLGILALPFVYYLIRKTFRHDWLALLAVFLAAINMFGIYYSQEIRMYSLIMLLASAALFFQVTLWEETTGKLSLVSAAGYCLSALGLLYSSLISIFFVAGIGAAMLLVSLWDLKQHPWHWKQVIVLHGIILLGFLPWLPALWRKSVDLKGGVWTGLVINHPREMFKFAFENLMFHSWKSGPGWDLANRILRLVMPFAIAGFWDRSLRRPLALLLLGLAFTFIFQYTLTLNRPFHTGRYFAAWWPFVFVVLIGALRGLELLARKIKTAGPWVGLGMAAAVATLYAFVQWHQLKYYYGPFEKENWRQAVAIIGREYRPEDRILVASNWDKNCWEYYDPKLRFISVDEVAANGVPPGTRRMFFASGKSQEQIKADLSGSNLEFQPCGWPVSSLNCVVWYGKK